MRLRPVHMLALIVVLTLVAGYLCLPGDTLDIGGIKDEVTVHQGLDLQGGLQVLLEANPPAGQDFNEDALEGTRDTIERRVNGLGVSEPLIQTRGDNQIIVELPGLDNVPDCLEDGNVDGCQPADLAGLADGNGDGVPDCLDDGDADNCGVEGAGGADRAVEVLQETALLEIIDPQGAYLPDGTLVRTTLDPDQNAPAATPVTDPGASPVAGGSPGASPEASPAVAPTPEATEQATGPVYTTIISGKDLEDAYPTLDENGRTVVGFELTDEGADTFGAFTQANIGQPMAIVLDKRVISSPVINAAIYDQGIIQGMPLTEVRDLVIQLKAGALDVPLTIVSSRTVGPQLGQDSIDRSLTAGIIGLATVALFMILYYRLPGILSVVALVIYTLITFALFKLIPVTLTLAGIAGFILSIGMAVDANILIFARLREEVRLGRTLSSAIEAAFDRSWPSIRDSNISTMITAAILYWFGNYSGATIITGFALTLFVGVAVSMFTAITVSRTFLRLLVDSGLANNQWWFGIERGERPNVSALPADQLAD